MPPGPRGRREKPKDAKGTLLRILKYIMDFRVVVFTLLLFTFASNIGNLLGPTFAGKAIGAASGAGQVDFDTVGHYALCMLAAYLFSNLMSFLVSLGMMRVGRRIADARAGIRGKRRLARRIKRLDRVEQGDQPLLHGVVELEARTGCARCGAADGRHFPGDDGGESRFVAFARERDKLQQFLHRNSCKQRAFNRINFTSPGKKSQAAGKIRRIFVISDKLFRKALSQMSITSAAWAASS